ncbi:MAG TPA: zf-HC2 domain-containing protein [Labilithrix sp.]|nr:zf-HC2 domain-containing protein [Labilithrix sp.]
MSGDACKSMGLLLGAHLDGQLDPVKTLEVEDHVAACEVCRERLALDRALRGSLKKAVKTATPDDVRARMLAAMAGESARETRRDEDELGAISSTSALVANGEGLDASADRKSTPGSRAQRPSMLRHWRTMLPLASAAALVMAWGAAGKQPVARGATDTMVPAGLSDDLLRDFVGQHSHSLPPEQADPKQVRQFERYVGVPVRVPQFSNAQFVGGRLVPLHGGERAAMLQYEVKHGTDVQRVTVFVYDPRKIQIGGANLAPRAIGTAEVRVGQTDGYSVALTQHGGVGYAMASDLDPESSANLVSAVDREQ